MNTLNSKLTLGTYASTMSSLPGVKAQEGQSSQVVVKSSARLQESVDLVKPVIVKTVVEQSSNKDLEKLMNEVNKKLSSLGDYMSFKQDKASGRSVFILIDANSQKVIKQYPSEEFLQVSARLTKYLEEHSNQRASAGEQVGRLLSITA